MPRPPILTALLTLALATACDFGTEPEPTARLLVFSKTEAFRHTSIPAGIAAVQEMGAIIGFFVEATEDATVFNATDLSRFDAVLFLNTTGNILNPTQQAAFEAFIQAGGGFIGVHSATDTEYDWPWYGALVGVYFKSHPTIQTATVTAVDLNHPSTAWMLSSIARTDEWYDFLAQPVGVNVLLTVDEATYTGGTMGATHPISWYHLYDGGRAFYTAMGHTEESYSDFDFLDHLAGGIFWALGLD